MGGEFVVTPVEWAWNFRTKNGLNYGVSPRAVPVEDFIVVTEVACENLVATSKEELRSKVTSIFKKKKKKTQPLLLARQCQRTTGY